MAPYRGGTSVIVRVRGIDPGTQHSWFADVETDGKEATIIDFGKWHPRLPSVDAVGVEFPSPRLIPRRFNAHILLSLCRIAATIALHESVSNKTYLIEFDEWVGNKPSAKTRSAIDSVFLKLFNNVKKKGTRYYVNDKVVNEHVRDAAVLAFYTGTRKVGV